LFFLFIFVFSCRARAELELRQGYGLMNVSQWPRHSYNWWSIWLGEIVHNRRGIVASSWCNCHHVNIDVISCRVVSMSDVRSPPGLCLAFAFCFLLLFACFFFTRRAREEQELCQRYGLMNVSQWLRHSYNWWYLLLGEMVHNRRVIVV
jgi:hypothetical protein